MAKKKTLKEIQSQSWLDIQQLNKNELREQINTLNTIANKRIRRLQERDLESPATREMELLRMQKSDTKQGLQKQLSTTLNFLEMKTSTIKGAKDYTKLSNELAKSMGFPETKQGRKDAWSVLEKYREHKPAVVQSGSDEKYRQIAEIVGKTGVTDPKDLEKMRQELDQFTDEFDFWERYHRNGFQSEVEDNEDTTEYPF